jgi:hypothetical protein
MTWFKVDDHLHSHSKTMKAGTEAMGLWVLAGSWSAAEESDGWIPGYVLTRLVGGNGDELAARLVKAGLWHADERDGEDGYQFHAWGEYQPTRADLEARREAQRERMRRARSQGGAVRAHSARSEDAVTPTPTRPDPTNNNTADAAAPEPDTFAAFWAEYPRKIGKAAAVKAYAKATKAADPDTILAGLRNAVAVWKATSTEDRFIPHASTWLNAGRWDDEQPMPGMPPPAAPRPTTLMQCPGEYGHDRHRWEDKRGTEYACMGVEA